MGILKSVTLMTFLLSLGAIYSIKALFRWGDTSLNREFIQTFGKFAHWLVGIELIRLNEERLYAHRPAVLVGNHQSGIDLAIIGYMCPTDTVIIAKKEIAYIPFFGWFLRGAGNLLINRSQSRKAREALLGVIQILKEKKLDLAIMPEGTRNRNQLGSLMPFKKGAFTFAIEAQIPVIAAVCSNLEGIGIWEKHQLKGGKVIMSVLEPIETKGMTQEDVGKLTQLVWDRMNEELKRINELVKSS